MKKSVRMSVLRGERIWTSLVLVAALGFALPALGQGGKGELFGGYSLEHIGPGCGTDYTCGSSSNLGHVSNFNGWAVAATGYVTRLVGVTAQVTGNYNSRIVPAYSSAHRFSYEFGPVFSLRSGRVNPFVHALVGGVTQRTPDSPGLGYTKFAWSFGGGVDLKLSHHLSIRAGQIDYEGQRVPVEGATGLLNQTATSNGLRFSTGVVFRF